MRFGYLRTTFTGGEISPELSARFDLPNHAGSCSYIENFIPLVYGAITRTPGSKYLRAIDSDSYAPRLIPFQASDESRYILEFADGKITISNDEGFIVDDRYPIEEHFALGIGISNWTERNVGTGDVTYDFINQRATFNGSSGNEARLYTRFANPSTSEYTISVVVGAGDLNIKAGSTLGGSEFGTSTLAASGTRTFSFTPTTNDCFCYIEIESATTSTADDITIDAPNYTLDHPYLETDLQYIQVAQLNDVMYVVCPGYIPRRLARKASNWWQFTVFDSSSTNYSDDPSQVYTEGPYLALNTTDITLTPEATTGTILLTSSSDLFTSTDIGRLVRWRMGPENSARVSYSGNGTQKNFDITWTDYTDAQTEITVYTISAVGVVTTATYTTDYTIADGQVVFGTAPASGVTVRIERDPDYTSNGLWGFGRIVQYISPTIINLLVLSDLNGIQPSTEWQLGAFSTTTGYPRTVAFHEQRLAFGGTTSNPDMIFISALGNAMDHSPDGYTFTGTVSANNALTLTAAANKLTTIEWLSSRVNLIVGTSSSVFELVSPTSGLSALELPSVLKRNENGTRRGTNAVQIGSSVIYTNRTGNRLLDLNYDITISSLEALDMSILASHLFSSPIKRIAYQTEPDQIIWLLCEDGSLYTCTYVRESQMRAFARQNFGGTIDDIISMVDGSYTSVYLAVNRNGIRSLEKVMQRFTGESLEDAWFVTNGSSYDATQENGCYVDQVTGTGILTATDSVFDPNDVGRYIQFTVQNVGLRIKNYIGPTSVQVEIGGTLTSSAVDGGDWVYPVTTLSGLAHLAGQEVSILGDGFDLGTATVGGGGDLTLPIACTKVVVGLPFDATFTTSDFAVDGQQGSMLAHLRRVRQAKLNLYKSYGGSISHEGTSSAALLTDRMPLTMGGRAELYTGWLTADLENDGDELGGKFTVTSQGAYPLTVCGVVLKCLIGDL